MSRSDRFLNACMGKPVDTTPVWIMRQAGRYLPEYRATRARAGSFMQLCMNPELACEVTLQPLRRYDLDAGIIFSDILTPLGPMGAEFDFSQGSPKLAAPLRTEADLARLRVVEPREELGFVAEAIGLVTGEKPETPLIGFAGAPLTLAAYLVEGGGSSDFRHFKALLYSRPEVVAGLLDTLADQVTRHLTMQVEAGCAAVQIFDSWASILHPHDYARVALPPIKKIIDGLAHLGVPRILFSKGGAGNLPALATVGEQLGGVEQLAQGGHAQRAGTSKRRHVRHSPTPVASTCTSSTSSGTPASLSSWARPAWSMAMRSGPNWANRSTRTPRPCSGLTASRSTARGSSDTVDTSPTFR